MAAVTESLTGLNPREALITALQKNDVEAAEEIYRKHGKTCLTGVSSTRKPLIMAAVLGGKRALEWMILHDPTSQNACYHGRTPILEAIRHDKLESLQFLYTLNRAFLFQPIVLRSGTEEVEKDPSLYLHTALRYEAIQCCQFLLSLSSPEALEQCYPHPTSAPDSYHYRATLLHHAALEGNIRAVRMLVSLGARLHRPFKGGSTHLHLDGNELELTEGIIAAHRQNPGHKEVFAYLTQVHEAFTLLHKGNITALQAKYPHYPLHKLRSDKGESLLELALGMKETESLKPEHLALVLWELEFKEIFDKKEKEAQDEKDEKEASEISLQIMNTMISSSSLISAMQKGCSTTVFKMFQLKMQQLQPLAKTDPKKQKELTLVRNLLNTLVTFSMSQGYKIDHYYYGTQFEDPKHLVLFAKEVVAESEKDKTIYQTQCALLSDLLEKQQISCEESLDGSLDFRTAEDIGLADLKREKEQERVKGVHLMNALRFAKLAQDPKRCARVLLTLHHGKELGERRYKALLERVEKEKEIGQPNPFSSMMGALGIMLPLISKPKTQAELLNEQRRLEVQQLRLNREKREAEAVVKEKRRHLEAMQRKLEALQVEIKSLKDSIPASLVQPSGYLPVPAGQGQGSSAP